MATNDYNAFDIREGPAGREIRVRNNKTGAMEWHPHFTDGDLPYGSVRYADGIAWTWISIGGATKWMKSDEYNLYGANGQPERLECSYVATAYPSQSLDAALAMASSEVFNTDLNVDPDSPLAVSVAQIVQGVIGQLISQHGGLAKLLRGNDHEDQPSIDKYGDVHRPLNLNSLQIKNVGAPFEMNDATTKCYVDGSVLAMLQSFRNELSKHEQIYHPEGIPPPPGSVEELRQRVAHFSLLQ